MARQSVLEEVFLKVSGSGLQDVDVRLQGLERTARRTGTRAGRALSEGFKAAGRIIRGTLDGITQSLERVNPARLLAGGAGTAGIALAFRSLATEAFQAEAALRLLDRQFDRNNINVVQGREDIEALAAELKVLPIDLNDNIAQLLRVGLSLEDIGTLFRGGAASALTFGKDTATGINNVTAAIITGQSRLLDTIGITQNLGQEYQTVARDAGKTANELTQLERAQAGVQLVFKATREEVQDLPVLLEGVAGSSSNLRNSIKELRIAFGENLQQPVADTQNTLAALAQTLAETPEEFQRFILGATGALTVATALGVAVRALTFALAGLGGGPVGILVALGVAAAGAAAAFRGSGRDGLSNNAAEAIDVIAGGVQDVDGFVKTLGSLRDSLSGDALTAWDNYVDRVEQGKDAINDVRVAAEDAARVFALLEFNQNLFDVQNDEALNPQTTGQITIRVAQARREGPAQLVAELESILAEFQAEYDALEAGTVESLADRQLELAIDAVEQLLVSAEAIISAEEDIQKAIAARDARSSSSSSSASNRPDGKTAAEIIAETEQALQDAEEKAELLPETFDLARAQLSILRGAVDDLVARGNVELLTEEQLQKLQEFAGLVESIQLGLDEESELEKRIREAEQFVRNRLTQADLDILDPREVARQFNDALQGVENEITDLGSIDASELELFNTLQDLRELLLGALDDLNDSFPDLKVEVKPQTNREGLAEARQETLRLFEQALSTAEAQDELTGGTQRTRAALVAYIDALQQAIAKGGLTEAQLLTLEERLARLGIQFRNLGREAGDNFLLLANKFTPVGKEADSATQRLINFETGLLDVVRAEAAVSGETTGLRLALANTIGVLTAQIDETKRGSDEYVDLLRIIASLTREYDGLKGSFESGKGIFERAAKGAGDFAIEAFELARLENELGLANNDLEASLEGSINKLLILAASGSLSGKALRSLLGSISTLKGELDELQEGRQFNPDDFLADQADRQVGAIDDLLDFASAQDSLAGSTDNTRRVLLENIVSLQKQLGALKENSDAYKILTIALAGYLEQLDELKRSGKEGAEEILDLNNAVDALTRSARVETINDQFEALRDRIFEANEEGRKLNLDALQDLSELDSSQVALLATEVGRLTGTGPDRFQELRTLLVEAAEQVGPKFRDELLRLIAVLDEFEEGSDGASDRLQAFQDRVDALSDSRDEFERLREEAEALRDAGELGDDYFSELDEINAAAFESLADAVQRLTGDTPERIDILREGLDKLEAVAPKLKDQIDALRGSLDDFAESARVDPVEEFRERLARFGQDETPFERLSRELAELRERTDLTEEEIAEFEARIRELQVAATIRDIGQQFTDLAAEIDGAGAAALGTLGGIAAGIATFIERGQDAEDITFALAAAFGALGDAFPEQESFGNQLVSGLFAIGGQVAELVTGIPGLGQAVGAFGELFSRALGDLGNSLEEIREETEELSKDFEFIDPSGLIVTEQVSRGGILGLLGFSKAQIDEEATQVGLDIARAIEGGFASGLGSAVDLILRGEEGALEALEEGLFSAVSGAVTEAIIQGAVIEGALGDLLTQITEAFAAGDFELGADLVKDALSAVPGLLEALEEALGPLGGLFPGLADEAEELASTIPDLFQLPELPDYAQLFAGGGPVQAQVETELAAPELVSSLDSLEGTISGLLVGSLNATEQAIRGALGTGSPAGIQELLGKIPDMGEQAGKNMLKASENMLRAAIAKERRRGTTPAEAIVGPNVFGVANFNT